ncbi:MAG TPA: ABC transporter substrate-binding protein [Streptosporangiaceae bacterium]|nr:ABC transporter substrate-binding protein [Streptosporangiaceae bacterium]
MHMWHNKTGPVLVAAAGLLVAGLAACGSSGSSSGGQVSASAKQTIVFATQGLGSEGTATKTAVTAFEKLHPNIKVQILSLSPTSDVAFEQLTQRFTAGSSTPDVITSDVIWPAQFAQSGWLADLTKFHPNTSAFFPGQMATGQVKGGVYAIPWFINAEGLYYRTDLIKTPPTTTAQLFSDAVAAMKKDSKLKEGLAFEGDKYEGAVTAFQSMGGEISTSQLGNLNSSANNGVLTMMYDAISKYHIAPTAVSTWEESQVQNAWLSGQTPFALNWPYIFALSDGKGCMPSCAAVNGKTGWVPFPNPVGSPQASLGGDDLVVNAKSTHQAAAWEFIQYLSSNSAQIARAISAGDPPSVKSAHNSQLYAAAPYFKQEQAVFAAATPRPVTPVYTQISSQLQAMISSVLSGQSSPSSALSGAAPTVKDLLSTVQSGG